MLVQYGDECIGQKTVYEWVEGLKMEERMWRMKTDRSAQ
jgi:hypothetical protein